MSKLFNSILNRSNSYNYYKNNFNRLLNSEKDLKESNKKLQEENDNLNRLLSYYKGTFDSTLPGRLLTKKEVITFQPDDPYYDEQRWDMYYQEMVEELLKLRGINSVLELGPYKAPFIEGCDVMDRWDFSEYFPLKVNKVILHDCSEVPFPIKDKEYDLVIACQCLEHFGIRGEQVDAFKEIARISKKAIVSLPYKWYRPRDRDHHMIDERVFDDWQGDLKHYYQRTSKHTIVRIYDFENQE